MTVAGTAAAAVVVSWWAMPSPAVSVFAQSPDRSPVTYATPLPTQPVDWPDLPDLDAVEPEVRTAHFDVYAADPADPLLVASARRWAVQLEAIGTLIASRLGIGGIPDHPVRVQFARSYEAACPARGLASHANEMSTIAVFVDETTTDIQVRAVMAHEITHAYTFGEHFVGDGVLTEGIANWAPGGLVRTWQKVDAWPDEVRRLLDSGMYISVADPGGLQPAPGEDCISRRDRVYNIRAAFTEWLVDRIGTEEVLAMPSREVQEAGEGSQEPVRKQVPDYHAATGFTLDQLETIWLAEITGRT